MEFPLSELEFEELEGFLNGQKCKTLFTSEEHIYNLVKVDKKKMYHRSKMWKRKKRMK